MKHVVYLFIGGIALLTACGARVTLGDLPADHATEDSSAPTLPGDGTQREASTPADGTAAIDAGPAPYASCAGKACGDSCTLCAPGDPNCFETAVIKQCDVSGTCGASAPACDIDAGTPYDPCAGKVCGSSCTICRPGDVGCFETAVIKQCSLTGQCTPSPAAGGC